MERKVAARASKDIITHAQSLIDTGQLDENTFCWAGRKLAKNANWEQCFDILMVGYEIGVETDRNGDTTLTLYKDGEATSKEVLKGIFDVSRGDWEWNAIYKHFCELLYGGRKKRKKVRVDLPDDLGLEDLKKEILTAKGAKKRKLIEEYNAKSKLLSAQAPSADIDDLKRQRGNLRQRINYAKKRGNPTEELEKELNEILVKIETTK